METSSRSFICSKMFTDVVIKAPYREIKNCCKTEGYVVQESDLVAGFLTEGQEYMARKKAMVLHNELPLPACKACARNVDNSLFSVANRWQDSLPVANKADLLLMDSLLSYEFMLSSACDLKCIYCAPKDSSSWALQLNVSKMTSEDSWSNAAKALVLDHIKNKVFDNTKEHWFVFSGGEPTYNNDIISLIEEMIVASNGNRVTFVINTNANTKPALVKRFTAMFNAYPTIQWVMYCSVDCIGDRFEAIRNGASWETVIGNIEEYLKYDNVAVAIAPTINLYSIPFLLEYIEFFVTMFKQRAKLLEFQINKTVEDGISAENMPGYYKRYVIDAINYCKANNVNEDFIQHLVNISELIGTKLSEQPYLNLVYKFNYFKTMDPNSQWDALFPHVNDIIAYYEQVHGYKYSVKDVIPDPINGLQVLTVIK